MGIFFGGIVYARGMTVHVVPKHLAYLSKHCLLRLFACTAGAGVHRLFAAVISDSATEGGFDGPLVVPCLAEGEMDIASYNTNILGVVGERSMYGPHAVILLRKDRNAY